MPTAPRQILVVDAAEETRQLLCELLDRTGLMSSSSPSADEAIQQMKRGAHAAVVIDADTISTNDWARMLRAGAGTGSAIVVAGTNRPESQGFSGVTFVRKPYHYRDLVHTIQEVLDAMDSQARAAA